MNTSTLVMRNSTRRSMEIHRTCSVGRASIVRKFPLINWNFRDRMRSNPSWEQGGSLASPATTTPIATSELLQGLRA